MAGKKAQNMKQVAKLLQEYDSLSQHITDKNDKKDLDEMAERFADAEHPNIEKMTTNLAFWKRKVGASSSGERKRSNRRCNRTLNKKRNRKTRKY